MAEPYYLYGRALLELAREKSAMFGKAIPGKSQEKRVGRSVGEKEESDFICFQGVMFLPVQSLAPQMRLLQVKGLQLVPVAMEAARSQLKPTLKGKRRRSQICNCPGKFWSWLDSSVRSECMCKPCTTAHSIKSRLPG